MRFKRSRHIFMKPTRTKLGAFVRKRRLKLGLTQLEVAIRCGKHASYISNLERGNRGWKRLTAPTVEKLACVFGCSSQDLIACMPETRSLTKFGRFIRARRKALGLTIQQFAHRLKITREVAYDTEVRRKGLRPAQIERFAHALEVDLEAIVQFVLRTPWEKRPRYALGKLIRTRRRALGLSLREVAHQLGVAFQFLSAVELGRSPLTRKKNRHLERLAAILGLDLDECESLKKKRA